MFNQLHAVSSPRSSLRSTSRCPRLMSDPTAPPWDAQMAQLWEKPVDLARTGPVQRAVGSGTCAGPGCDVSFRREEAPRDQSRLTVTDPQGREWKVKQPPTNDQGAEDRGSRAVARARPPGITSRLCISFSRSP